MKKTPVSGIVAGLLAGSSLLTLTATGAIAAAAPADVIIAGGTVYTGADVAPTTADVVIVGDKIAYVGPGAASRYQAKTTIDAKGKIVTPGFIDAHAHPDSYIRSTDAKERINAPWIFQGVTTLMIGIDGGGTPDISDEAAKFGADGIGTNVAPYVGFGSIREKVMKNDDREPSAAELEQERQLTIRGMCQGAWGLSTGLFYSPQSYSKTEEVITLAKEAAKRGGIYDTHQRDEASYTIGLMGSVAEVLRIGREAGIPVHFGHIKALGIDVQGKAPQVIAQINAARAQGLEVTADQYPWSASGTSVEASLIPRWAENGGREALLKRFADPVQLEKIRSEMRDNMRRRGGAESMLLISANQPWTGKNLAEMGKTWNVEPIDAGIRIIKEGRDGGSVASFNMTEADIAAFMKQPWTITSSDGSNGHPRQYATFPRKYVKYVKEDHVISLAEFIRSSTGRSADVLHLDNRGYLKGGAFADVAVIDLNRYAPKADYVHPKELAEGVDQLFVNGKAVIKDGKSTGDLPGRTLLHKPPAGTCS